VTYRLIPPETPISAYKPPTIRVECLRCRKNAPDLEVAKLVKRFGRNIAVGDLARQVALASRQPCGLAATGQCGARALEPPVWMWAELEDAWRGGWLARLHCRRHHAALKKTQPCPEVVILDVETLIAAYGYDTKLERLPTRMICPRCHSSVVAIEWIVPDETPAPFAPPAADPVRLKPTRTEVGRRRLRVVDGGKS